MFFFILAFIQRPRAEGGREDEKGGDGNGNGKMKRSESNGDTSGDWSTFDCDPPSTFECLHVSSILIVCVRERHLNCVYCEVKVIGIYFVK